MKKILFFSYKGGVGRSLAVCNVAASLCRKGFRVGIVDFDVEAPSIHIHLKSILPSGWIYDEMAPDILTLLKSDFEPSPKDIKDAAIQLTIPIKKGSCILLPCFGRENDLEDLELNWREKVGSMEKIFEMFADVFKLDFILVDSRTGYSQQAILAAFNVDQVIAISRADEVSLLGMKLMIDIFRDRPMEKIHLIITGMPNDISPNDPRIKKFAKALEMSGKEICIPYVSDWYFGGSVLWKNKDNFLILKLFDRLTSKILKESE